MELQIGDIRFEHQGNYRFHQIKGFEPGEGSEGVMAILLEMDSRGGKADPHFIPVARTRKMPVAQVERWRPVNPPYDIREGVVLANYLLALADRISYETVYEVSQGDLIRAWAEQVEKESQFAEIHIPSETARKAILALMGLPMRKVTGVYQVALDAVKATLNPGRPDVLLEEVYKTKSGSALNVQRDSDGEIILEVEKPSAWRKMSTAERRQFLQSRQANALEEVEKVLRDVHTKWICTLNHWDSAAVHCNCCGTSDVQMCPSFGQRGTCRLAEID
jgi:bifunctional DNA-binding transcriptional regulator/antitoxin component of YhaV-PrlF toxin-antitoxin module